MKSGPYRYCIADKPVTELGTLLMMDSTMGSAWKDHLSIISREKHMARRWRRTSRLKTSTWPLLSWRYGVMVTWSTANNLRNSWIKLEV